MPHHKLTTYKNVVINPNACNNSTPYQKTLFTCIPFKFLTGRNATGKLNSENKDLKNNCKMLLAKDSKPSTSLEAKSVNPTISLYSAVHTRLAYSFISSKISAPILL